MCCSLVCVIVVSILSAAQLCWWEPLQHTTINCYGMLHSIIVIDDGIWCICVRGIVLAAGGVLWLHLGLWIELCRRCINLFRRRMRQYAGYGDNTLDGLQQKHQKQVPVIHRCSCWYGSIPSAIIN